MRIRCELLIVMMLVIISCTGCGAKYRTEITDIQAIIDKSDRQIVSVTYIDGDDTRTMKHPFAKVRVGEKNEIETGYVFLVYVDQETYDRLYKDFDELAKKQADVYTHGGINVETVTDESP